MVTMNFDQIEGGGGEGVSVEGVSGEGGRWQ